MPKSRYRKIRSRKISSVNDGIGQAEVENGGFINRHPLSLDHYLNDKMPLGFIGVIFSLLGMAFLFLGWQDFTSTNALLNAAIRTQGIVVGLHQEIDRDSDGSSTTYYYPIIEFKIRDGRTVHWVSNVGSAPADLKVGDRVEMLYDHHSPEKARIYSFSGLWMGPTLIGGFGTIFMLVGFMIFASAMNFDATVLLISVVDLTANLLRSKKKKEEAEIDTLLPPPS